MHTLHGLGGGGIGRDTGAAFTPMIRIQIPLKLHTCVKFIENNDNT